MVLSDHGVDLSTSRLGEHTAAVVKRIGRVLNGLEGDDSMVVTVWLFRFLPGSGPAFHAG